MKKIIIGTIILAILLIVFIINFQNNSRTSPLKKISCETSCKKVESQDEFNGQWIFRGKMFDTQGECLTACQTATNR